MATAAKFAATSRSDWPIEPLGSLGRWIGGGTPSKAEPAFWTHGTVPWVSAKDMKTAVIDRSADLITKEAVAQSAAKRIPAGSVLCVMRSGILAHTFPVAVNTIEVTVNQDLRALVVRDDVDPHYVAHFLRFSGSDILLTCSKHGTTVSSIEASRLARYPVPLPDLETQRHIVARIDELFSELDDGDEDLVRARADLKIYRKALLKAAVTGELTADWRTENPTNQSGRQLLERLLMDRSDRWLANPNNARKKYTPPLANTRTSLPSLPDSWDWASVSTLSDLVIDGDHNPPKRVDEGIPHLTARNVKNGALTFDKCSFVDAEGYVQTSSRYKPEIDDVIITCVGTLGETAIVSGRTDFSVDRNLAAVRVNKTFVCPEYLKLCLDAPLIQSIIHSASGSTAQPHLYLKDIRSLPIPLTPLIEQRAILQRVRDAWTEAHDAIEGSSTTLRQSILAAAFRGELVQ